MNFLKKFGIVFLFLCQFLFAQNDFGFVKISTLSQDDGLSQGANYFKFEDRKGFMWLSGSDAVNRFDGTNVKVYNLNYYFKNCPALQQVYGFAEDENYLYIGSTRGLYQYDYVKDEFILIDIFKKNKRKTAMPIGFSGGKMWCFNEDFEVATYEPKTGKIETVTKLPLKPFASLHIYGNEGGQFFNSYPSIDEHKNIWFTSSNNVLKFNTLNHNIDFPLQEYFNKNKIVIRSSLYDVWDRKFYVGTDRKLIIYDVKLNKTKEETKICGEPITYIASIAANEKMLALKNDNKLLTIYKSDGRFMKLDEKYRRGFNFGFDKAGRFWFCNDGLGMLICDFKGSLLKNSAEIISNKNYFTYGINNFSELPNQHVIINSRFTFNKEKKELNQEKRFTENSWGLNIRSYYDGKKNGTWSFTDDLKNTTVGFLSEKGNLKTYNSFSYEDYGKFQSFAGFQNFKPLVSFSKGVFWWDENSNNLKKIKQLPDNNPFYINNISKDRIAISYLNDDMILAKINSENDVKILKKILPGVQTFYIQEDVKNQQYWIGSNEGIYLLDKNFEILKKFDSNNGLSGTYIYGLLIDDLGTIWCSHQRGLSSIDTKNYRIINYDKEDGIQHWDFNNRAFLKTKDGTLFFGGVNGFNIIKPPLKLQSYYKPEIYIDEVLVNMERFPVKNGYNTLEEVVLKHDQNNVFIKIFIKDLEFGSQRKLLYRIANQNNNWRFIPAKTPLIFNSLAPGTYEIEFGIYDKFSNQASGIKKLTLTVNSAFYQTIWFWILIGGLLFGSIFAVYGRYKFLKQKEYYRNKIALENQRNKITADLHDDLGSALSSLQINSSIAGKMMKKNPEEAQKILDKIELQSQKISENIGDIIWSLKPGKDELMSLSMRIKNFANEILGSTNINYFINIDENVDVDIKDFTERKNIILIAKEAINNAAKYSDGNNINIIIQKKDHHYEMMISDNGKGFDTNKNKGNGIGNMKRRAEEISGNFEIISNEKGTVVKLNIPIISDSK